MPGPAKVNPRAIAALLMARHVRAAGHRPPPGPLPRQQPPDAIGLEYAAAMRALVERAIRAAYAPLLRALPAMLEHARRARGDAAEPSLVDRLVARLRGQPVTRHDDRTKEEVAAAEEAMASEVTDDRIRAAAAKAGQQADDLNRRQLGAQVKAVVGVDLVGTVPPALLDGFLDENVALISDITPALAARVQAAIHRALTTGQLHADLATVLDREMGYAADRAANIARDQIGKIYGQVNAKRQQDLGVTEFIWRTVGDERVRGNPGGKYPNAKPSHWDRDGKTYKYADPPRGAKGERELPGTPINCRCFGEPILKHLLDDLPDPGEGWQPPAALGVQLAPPPVVEGLTAVQHAAREARLAREAQTAADRAAWEAARAAKLAARQG